MKNKIFKNKLLITLIIIGVIAIFYLDNISDKILFFTFLALIWYAWETKGMKKEMVAQTELEQKPIVDLFYRPATQKHTQYLRLRNSGKGVAYNIEAEIIKEDDRTFEFFFEDPNLILTTGGEQTLNVNAKYKNERGGETWPGDALSCFLGHVKEKTWKNRNEDNTDLLFDKQKTKVTVTYENALKNKYKRIFYIYDQIVKTDNKKEYEVEFYKEEIL